jgi:hypothetical protein
MYFRANWLLLQVTFFALPEEGEWCIGASFWHGKYMDIMFAGWQLVTWVKFYQFDIMFYGWTSQYIDVTLLNESNHLCV